jgi:hypothetical protein
MTQQPLVSANLHHALKPPKVAVITALPKVRFMSLLSSKLTKFPTINELDFQYFCSHFICIGIVV